MTFECNDTENVIFREVYKVKKVHDFEQEIAIWNSKMKQFNSEILDYGERRSNLTGVTIINTVSPWDTFIIFLPPDTNRTVKYDGLFIDIALAMQDVMGFDIEWTVPADGNWGTLMPDGSMNGMVGQLERGEVDLSSTGLTVTQSRSAAADFTRSVHTGLITLVISINKGILK